MPRLPGLIQIAVLLLAAACAHSQDASAAVAATLTATKAPQVSAPAVQGSAKQPAPQSHPLDEPAAAVVPAMDPIPPEATAPAPTAGSILSPGRPRQPLVHSASEAPAIVPLGSEIPDGPVAAADAPRQACAQQRPTACNLDYRPVCANVDTGVRCIKAPCPFSSERKNFGSACKACRDPSVTAFVSGTCPQR